MKVKKYVSKWCYPFDAIQWDGTNDRIITDFIGKNQVVLVDKRDGIIVFNSLGKLFVTSKGDYLCKDDEGIVVAVPEENFKSTYKEASVKDLLLKGGER